MGSTGTKLHSNTAGEFQPELLGRAVVAAAGAMTSVTRLKHFTNVNKSHGTLLAIYIYFKYQNKEDKSQEKYYVIQIDILSVYGNLACTPWQ